MQRVNENLATGKDDCVAQFRQMLDNYAPEKTADQDQDMITKSELSGSPPIKNLGGHLSERVVPHDEVVL